MQNLVRWSSSFPEDSVDGPVFADKVHFMHPSIQQHHETVNPAVSRQIPGVIQVDSMADATAAAIDKKK